MNSELKPDIRNEASHEIRHQYLSAERARTMLGWHPLFTLDEGLTRAIAWYCDFLGEANDEFSGRELAASHSRSGQ